MKHLIKDTSKDGINTKCGRTVAKTDATAWWRDVTCPECSPYEWVPAEPGSKRMVRKDIVTKTGKVLTDADIEALVAEAEAGYDVSKLQERKRTIPRQ